MALYLVPPGKRKNNPFYLVRGEVNGRSVEVSTKTRDQTAALKFKAELELKLLEDRMPGPGDEITFARATDLYLAFKQPSSFVEKRIRRLAHVIEKPVSQVRHADLIRAADVLYAGRTNETKNRWVIKPAAAVLHYAAENGWCEWLRVKKLPEGPVKTRASNLETARALVDALEQEITNCRTDRKLAIARKKRLLILWLFKHGNRISDPLRLTWDEIDLVRRTYTLHIGKTRTIKEKPLDDEVWEALANEPGKSGFVFPWRTRSGVYKWLHPLCQELDIEFTPHMARHFVGTALNATGQGLKTIMGALDHADPKSSIRYQHVDLNIVREALKSMGKMVGNATPKGQKS